MGYEYSALFLGNLDPTFPATDDPVAQGDDHIRKLKDVLQETFPGFTRAIDTYLIPYSDTDPRTAGELFEQLLSDVAILTAEVMPAGTTLKAANNLSDVADAATALANLGGMAIALGLLKSNNLSDVADPAAALANLGGLSTATGLVKALNLSDVADATTALNNLGGASAVAVAAIAGDVATIQATMALDTAVLKIAQNLADLSSVPAARGNLDVYSTSETLAQINAAVIAAVGALANNRYVYADSAVSLNQNDNLLADVSGGGFTVNPMASPTPGAYHDIKPFTGSDFSTNNLTVATTDGELIMGAPSPYVIDKDGVYYLVYTGASFGWEVVNTSYSNPWMQIPNAAPTTPPSVTNGILAFGDNTTANGQKAIAIGNATHANGDYSVVVGYNMSTTGTDVVLVGDGNNTSGSYLICVGSGNYSDNGYSVNIGRSNNMYGTFATTIGYSNTNYSDAVVVGRGNTVSGVSAAYGKNNTILVRGASFGANYLGQADDVAVGMGNYVTAVAGIVIGTGAQTNHAHTTVLGFNTESLNPNSMGHHVQADNDNTWAYRDTVSLTIITSDATQTKMKAFNVAKVKQGVACVATLMIAAKQIGGSAGTVGDSAAWHINLATKVVSGTRSFIGTPTGTGVSTMCDAGAALWDVTLTAIADGIEIKVTGEVNKDISWIAQTVQMHHLYI